jgi:hypothetical protein
MENTGAISPLRGCSDAIASSRGGVGLDSMIITRPRRGVGLVTISGSMGAKNIKCRLSCDFKGDVSNFHWRVSYKSVAKLHRTPHTP